jgi:hypothetical protein
VSRINVYRYPDESDSFGETVRVGHFDGEKALRWDDRDPISGNGSGGPGRGQAVWRTSGGRWVLEHWTSWQGERDRYEFITDEAAREWLLANDCDKAVTEYFGEIEEERGPGRPSVGEPINVRLGELLGRVDAFAAEGGVTRAEAVRQLVFAGLDARWGEPALSSHVLLRDRGDQK